MTYMTIDKARKQLYWHFWKQFLLKSLLPVAILCLLIAYVGQAQAAQASNEPFNVGLFLLIWAAGPATILVFRLLGTWPMEKRRVDKDLAELVKRRKAEIRELSP